MVKGKMSENFFFFFGSNPQIPEQLFSVISHQFNSFYLFSCHAISQCSDLREFYEQV